MKIVQIITSLSIGGAETLLSESIQFYQLNGVNLDVIVLKDSNSFLVDKVKNDINGKIINIKSKSVYNPLIILKLITILRQYDIVHVHLFPTSYWVVLAKILSFGKFKIIFTEHSTHNKRRDIKIFKIIDRFIYSKIDKIVAITEEVKVQLLNHIKNTNQHNTLVIHNGVNLNKFQNAKSYSKDTFFTNESFILTQVSTFRYPKDQKTVIKCLSLLDEKFKLLLVGDGPLIEENRQLVDELNLKYRVKFLGFREDVANILKTSDAVILSSAYEGMSLSNIEGMCLNKPFIASNVKGLRDIVENDGILFEYGDYKNLANEIKKLAKNKDYYQLVSQKCLSKAEKYKIEYMVNNYIQLYRTLL